MKNFPRSRKADIVVQELDGEILIYDLIKDKAVSLNETSALIWQLCDGNKSVAQISELISKKSDAITNEDLVWLALDGLKKENLLENNDEVIIDYKGLSRREVIKKIGLTSLLAIPVIMSITVPVAAAAASVCGTTCNCGTGNNAVLAGGICNTTGGTGAACPAAPAGCNVCRSNTGGNNSAGTCFMA